MFNTIVFQLSGLFGLAACVIGLINAHPSSSLVSLTSLLVLYAIVVFLVKRIVIEQKTMMEKYKKQMMEARDALEATTQNLEERVERRTFEISVANASLNREIAERIQAEEETKQIKRRMELILESAGEGIFGLDAQGNVTFVNKVAADAVGFLPEELVGRSHHDLVHHSHVDGTAFREDECPIHQAYRDGKVHRGANELFWSKEGRAVPVEYVSTPIIEKKHRTGAVVVFKTLPTTTNRGQ